MKKTLVIGSAVADVIINLDHLPGKCEDVHVISQKMSLGGCGFNVSEIVHLFETPYIPFFPIGRGAYGDFIKKQFEERGIRTPVPQPKEENGCCYCFVEADGERTFISYHGAEYRFQPEWFEILKEEDIGNVYICGLEIEEETGIHIIHYLESHPQYQIFFAPGPRITMIPREKMNRVLAMHPILHLNEEEAIRYTRKCRSQDSKENFENPLTSVDTEELKKAAADLYDKTERPVIITLGKDGAGFYDRQGWHQLPGIPAKAIDTVGAGDSHIGAILAALAGGNSLEDAISIANRVAAKVVETKGAVLSKEEFLSIRF